MAGAAINPLRPLPRRYRNYTEDQNSRLHFACYYGDYKLALMLLLSADNDTEVRNVWQETPLHHCTSQGHLEIMLLLLDGGADVNALDKDNYTPLHHAIIHGNKEASQLLLCYGANMYTDLTMVEISTSRVSYMPRSPLELASHVHVCHSVLEKAQGHVWSLQHYCRLAIRKHLGVGKRRRIKELPLPRHLIAYLMSLPLDCSLKLHNNWDRVRMNTTNKSQRSSVTRDGSKFSNNANLQALRTLQNKPV